ncbi:hypothetical protein ACO0DA_20405 [Bacillus subtilis]|uniref:hypothetical protein n=1 Tax=Bacillus subtilis TaxID=1423 RepID=UPI00217D5832|nr:hypothetical protein [Bacillus subtilis]UWJ02619.1 hypothetical protein N0B18_06970 [Bacillus subtilis]WFO97852.1 hypothetical protein JEQ25_12540 [Bacillus subtilis]
MERILRFVYSTAERHNITTDMIIDAFLQVKQIGIDLTDEEIIVALAELGDNGIHGRPAVERLI